MTSAIRNHLQCMPIEEAQHTGLLLTRFLRTQECGGSKADQAYLLKAATAIHTSDAYHTAFHRWKQLHMPGALRFGARLSAPLLAGAGAASPTGVGITLHHTYGVPYLPGSSLKGVVRAGASLLVKEQRLTQDQFVLLFGDTELSGGCIFWDAWFDPESIKYPLKRDVLTVHHADYYTGAGGMRKYPTDYDEPNPVQFLSVRPDAVFLFTLCTPEGWQDFVRELTLWSLRTLGAGGKTNAGYGTFERIEKAPLPLETVENVYFIKRRGADKIDFSYVTNRQRLATMDGSIARALYASLDDSLRGKVDKAATAVDVQGMRDGNTFTVVRVTAR